MMTPRATTDAAKRMLAAIGASRYYIAIRQWRRDGSDVMQPHIGPLTTDEIVGGWRQWQRRNAACADILVRIADEPPPCVLIDDVDADALRRIRSELPVRAVVETSPRNFQAWVPRPPDVDALAWSRALAQRYGGDSGAVQARQPGRLPGLTNRKPRHGRADGRGPWIVLRHCDATARPPSEDIGALLLAGTEPRAAAAAAAVPTPSTPLAVRRPPPGGGRKRSPSEDEWALARRMLWQGATVEQVEAAVLASATKRVKRGAHQYAERTARKAAASLSPTNLRVLGASDE